MRDVDKDMLSINQVAKLIRAAGFSATPASIRSQVEFGISGWGNIRVIKGVWYFEKHIIDELISTLKTMF